MKRTACALAATASILPFFSSCTTTVEIRAHEPRAQATHAPKAETTGQEAVEELGALAAPVREPFVVEVPASLARLEFLPLPAGKLGDVDVDSFWMSTTEVPWEAYDVLVHRLDLPEEDRAADAETRPSKPYINMDRGFGHNGYPALSMSALGASTFCAWLSEQTGRTLRLPTEAEWEYACRAGSQGAWSTGDVEAAVDEVAWHRGNSDWKTHPVGTKQPNGFGLFDLHGNAAEWCTSSVGAGAIVRGGSYKDSLAGLRADHRLEPTPDWNASDPQMPKSVWWLADAGWIGFRVVCVD